jgi:hypothetical protein
VAALVGDAVKHGATAVERVHLATARRSFMLIEHVPGIGVPTQGVHAVHDVAVSSVYQSVRAVSAMVTKAVDVTLEIVGRRETGHEPQIENVPEVDRDR